MRQSPSNNRRAPSAPRQVYNLVTGLAVLGIIGAIAAAHRIAYECGWAADRDLM